MATYANLPDEKDVLRLEARAVDARRVAAAEHANFIATRRDLDDPKSKASRNLTPGERFEETIAAQKSASAKIAAALGDPEANREALGRFAEALDLRGIVDRAEFLPLMSGTSESTAHDLRVIARKTMRDEYRDRLSRMKPEEVVTEARRIARDAGHEPHQTPELAKLGELHRHVGGQTGGDWTPAKSAVIGARSGIESNWRARTSLVESVQRAAHAFDAAHDLAGAVRDGRRETSATTKAREIGRALVAAGKS